MIEECAAMEAPREKREGRDITVSVRNDGNRDVHTARVTVKVNGRAFTALGHSKREPGDQYHEYIAKCLAVGRALEEVAEKILRDTELIVSDLTTFKDVQQATAQLRRVQARERTAEHNLQLKPGRLPISVIRKKYGVAAAVRATNRRRRKK